MWEKGNCTDKDCEISEKWRPKVRESWYFLGDKENKKGKLIFYT